MASDARAQYEAVMKQRVEEAQRSGEVRTCIHITPDKYTVEMPQLMIRTNSYLTAMTMFVCIDCYQKSTLVLGAIISGRTLNEVLRGE